jgi:hypothetical protein
MELPRTTIRGYSQSTRKVCCQSAKGRGLFISVHPGSLSDGDDTALSAHLEGPFDWSLSLLIPSNYGSLFYLFGWPLLGPARKESQLKEVNMKKTRWGELSSF